MATSPNYGWLEPDNTDLVKNGALAIRTLGNAIDTTMATMTPKSTYTAKGSIAAATAASTPANLAVGNNGETLVADSSTSTGLRYTAGNPIPNPVLNSAFQVWQRGTSLAGIASGNNYTADRWIYYAVNANGTMSRQTTSDSTNLPNIQYCARILRTAGSTATGQMNLTQGFETINSVPFAGKTVTFSFYARAGANYSATGNNLVFQINTGTGTDQNPYSGYTGSAQPISSTATLTTTWQRFTATGTIAATALEMSVQTIYYPTGTAGANDYYEITGVQVDIGSVALPFRTNGATIQGELAACQRYYVRYSDSSLNYPAFGIGQFHTTTGGTLLISPQVTMRTKPASVEYANLGMQENFAGGIGAVTSLIIESATATAGQLWVSASGSATYTQFRTARLIGNNSSSAYIGFSAEL